MSDPTSRRMQMALTAIWDGWPVIPLDGKLPLIRWKEFQDRLPDDAEVDGWPWGRASGMALVIGPALWKTHPNVWGLDAEAEHRDAAEAWLDANVTGWRAGKVAESGGGGLHVYCRASGPVTTAKSPWGDVKGDASYIVMPPSSHPSGGRYRWLSENEPVRLEPERLPGYQAEKTPIRDLLRERIPKGARNETLFRYGSKLRGDGIPLETIETILHGINETQCDPPMEQSEEVAEIVDSIGRRYEPNPTVTVGSNGRTEGVPSGPGDADGGRRFSFLTIEDLRNLPPQQWAIEGILVADSMAELFGQPGSYKSFVALDWSLCVASGKPWQGHAVEQGPVVYIAGEGVGGLRKRVDAWCTVQPDANTQDFWILPEALRSREPADHAAFLSELPREPVMVVIDTLNRSLAGGNENSPEDMGQFIELCDRIRAATGAVVLTVHHPDKTGAHSRGHSSFQGTLQTSVEAKASDGSVTLRARKQKDNEPFDTIHLQTRVVELDHDRPPETSLVLDISAGQLTPNDKKVLEALKGAGKPQIQSDEWLGLALESGVPKSSFYDSKSRLLLGLRVIEFSHVDGKRYRLNQAVR